MWHFKKYIVFAVIHRACVHRACVHRTDLLLVWGLLRLTPINSSKVAINLKHVLL